MEEREEKFTKGPWAITHQGFSEMTQTFQHQIGTPVHTVAYTYKDREEKTIELEANAHLIAAAPELYEALDQALPHLESYASQNRILSVGLIPEHAALLETVRAALSKAKGEQS